MNSVPVNSSAETDSAKFRADDLIKALERHRDWKVVIPVKLPHATMGGSPVVGVTGAFAGFDWDHGKIFVRPEAALYPVGPEFEDAKKLVHFYEERVGWALHALRANVSDAERVKNAIKSLMRKPGDAEAVSVKKRNGDRIP